VAASRVGALPSLPAWFDNTLSVTSGTFPTVCDFAYSHEGPVEIVASSGIANGVPWLGNWTRKVSSPSYSAPVVTGIVALIRQRYPQATLTDVRTVLEELGEPL